MNDFYYAAADLAGIAAAYAFHIAQAQAFLDGNKRTAIGAALVFLERSGVETRTECGDTLYKRCMPWRRREWTNRVWQS